jgi:calpain
MMGCSVSGDTEREVVTDGFRTGILANHAYGIVDIVEIKNPKLTRPRKTHRLLRVRNPWGKVEWKGKWSDTSEEVEKNKALIEKYNED